MVSSNRQGTLLAVLGPGLLVAATGVGAGDLATAGFTGEMLGVAVLWAVVVGALLKFVLNEGLARWQLVTGQTVLEGAMTRLGPSVTVVFGLYLLPWSFFVGAALISACGVTSAAMLPFADDSVQTRLVLGAVHSAAGVAIALLGGFRLFERLMAACVAVMVVTVVATALMIGPDWPAVARGLFVPTIPRLNDGGLTWTIALMGGVGGTLTILCYGYWMRAHGRVSIGELRTCRIDLGVAYAGTALFGIAIIMIAAGMKLDARGADLVVALATQLDTQLGPAARWIFLTGAWAAVFTSLLGVWQAVPLVFADAWRTACGRTTPPDPKGLPYRVYLVALAVVPLVHVTQPWRDVQKYYAVIGAGFLPLLALVLLVLNGRTRWIGREHRNRPATVAVLVAILVFFAIAGVLQVRARWGLF